jgi:hypothetical protein
MSDNPFEFVGWVTLSGSRNSVKSTPTKPLNVGESIYISVKDVQRVLKERWFIAKWYRLNYSTPIPPRKTVVKEADPEKLSFNLNLF